MIKTILLVLVSIVIQTNNCFAGSALEAAGLMGAKAADTAPAAVPAPDRVGADLTAQFFSAWRAPGQGLGEKELTELRKCKVLLVRGFMTGGYVDPIQIFGRPVTIGRYFNDQKEELARLGVEFAMADIDSVMPPAHNAAKVAKEIQASEKPVIIISHSDGGMYALQALVENPALAAKVRGFISLQAPFAGSPVADYVRGNKLLSSAMAKTLGHFGGTMEALESLTPARRGSFRNANRGAIGGIVAKVNVISFASWKEEKHSRFDTLLEISRDFMLERGIQNDGLVPVDSAILPGSDFIKVEGIDHIVPVMSADMVMKFDRKIFTRTLLSVLLSK
jgi:pimeloyl-ACP methyl ester carboxylesterase